MVRWQLLLHRCKSLCLSQSSVVISDIFYNIIANQLNGDYNVSINGYISETCYGVQKQPAEED